HTARSRNDQVALDLRLWALTKLEELAGRLNALIAVLLDKAGEYAAAVMPGYTHLQRAQPITLGHWFMAYVEMLLRDYDRLGDCAKRMNVNPLGSGALAGTTYPIDREFVAKRLGMNGVTQNSLDGVSDRDFALELLSALSIIMVHLSRFAEEIILFTSGEFGFFEPDDAFSTGSSIMPQKKNPDIAELIRGKSGRVFGDLFTLLTVMKGLGLAYNKDMQEDKEAVFDGVDTVLACLTAAAPMLATIKINTGRMRQAASQGFINATDCADYLVRKGLPFRDAYKIIGRIVARCIEQSANLEDLPIATYREFSELFDEDVYEAINLENCVNRRNMTGAPAPEQVKRQIERVREVRK
ncbi:MAG: argininosuccinate lyase, partial [Oscillospiraceae bacterium]|nr:argininosuccinate lyase [Oscillospiraceae bacterium]